MGIRIRIPLASTYVASRAKTKAHGAVRGGRLGAAVGLGPLVLGPAREERGECAVIYFDKKD